MYYPAKLEIRNYVPLSIERGMFFKTPEGEVWENIENICYKYDIETFYKLYGYPIELYIKDEDVILATPDQVGWMDDGESSDELRDIEADDVSYIINQCEGSLLIDIEEKGDEIVPIFAEGKIILKLKL